RRRRFARRGGAPAWKCQQQSHHRQTKYQRGGFPHPHFRNFIEIEKHRQQRATRQNERIPDRRAGEKPVQIGQLRTGGLANDEQERRKARERDHQGGERIKKSRAGYFHDVSPCPPTYHGGVARPAQRESKARPFFGRNALPLRLRMMPALPRYRNRKTIVLTLIA